MYTHILFLLSFPPIPTPSHSPRQPQIITKHQAELPVLCSSFLPAVCFTPVLRYSAVSYSETPWTHILSPWYSPGKNTGVGSHSFLQGVFPTEGKILGLLHCRRILYRWATREAHFTQSHVVVYICQCYSLNSSHLPPPLTLPCVHKSTVCLHLYSCPANIISSVYSLLTVSSEGELVGDPIGFLTLLNWAVMKQPRNLCFLGLMITYPNMLLLLIWQLQRMHC